MKKENKSHTTIRNKNLFCTYCGKEQTMPYPVSIEMFTAMVKVFEKAHKNCIPTWKEPQPMPTDNETENAKWWLLNASRGTSSETIFSVLCEEPLLPLLPKGEYSHPRDPDDFNRCYLLLKAVPQWKSKLNKLKPISSVWENIVNNWGKLTQMLEEQKRTGKPAGMYGFMKSLGC